MPSCSPLAPSVASSGMTRIQRRPEALIRVLLLWYMRGAVELLPSFVSSHLVCHNVCFIDVADFSDEL